VIIEHWFGAGAALVVILGGTVAWFRWLRQPWRRMLRFFDRLDLTINGRPAEIDPWGREEKPAVPALAEQMTGIKEQVEKLAANDARLSALEITVAEHGQRLTAIDAGHQVERTMSHVAQAKTFDAIEAVARKGEKDADSTE